MYDKDTTPEARAFLIERYRAMPVTAKVKLVFDACETGRMLAFAGIRYTYPDITDEMLWRLWAKRHLGEELFNIVYGE